MAFGKGKKLTENETEQAKAFCWMRDGRGCRHCPPQIRKLQTLEQMILDHIDNDSLNNPKSGTNWQNLCVGHNHRKNPRGKSRYRVMRSLSELRTSKPTSLELKLKQQLEPQFFEWVRLELEDRKQWSYEEIINSGAFIFKLSQKTLERYLDSYCSEHGPFELGEDELVRIKRSDQALPDIDANSIGSSPTG